MWSLFVMLTQHSTTKTQFKYITLCCLKSEFECITFLEVFLPLGCCCSLLSPHVKNYSHHFLSVNAAVLKSAPVPLLLSLPPLHKTKQHSHFPTTPDSPKALPCSRTHTGVRTYSPPAREHELPNQF